MLRFVSWKELVDEYFRHCEPNFTPEEDDEDQDWTKEVAEHKLMLDVEMDSDYFKTRTRIDYHQLKEMSEEEKALAYYYVLGNHDYAMDNMD